MNTSEPLRDEQTLVPDFENLTEVRKEEARKILPGLLSKDGLRVEPVPTIDIFLQERRAQFAKILQQMLEKQTHPQTIQTLNHMRDATEQMVQTLLTEERDEWKNIDFTEWTHKIILPALEHFARSQCTNFRALNDVSHDLNGKLRSEWESIIQKIPATIRKKQSEYTESTQDELMKLRFNAVLHLLNREWFIRKNRILVRATHFDEREHDPSVKMAKYAAEIVLMRIERVSQFDFSDGEKIPVCFLRQIDQRASSPAHYDPSLDAVMIDLDIIQKHTQIFRNAATSTEDIAQTAHPEEKAYKKVAPLLYSFYEEHVNVMIIDEVERTLIEELRHAINARRVHAKIGTKKDDYHKLYADILLSEKGHLRSMMYKKEDDYKYASIISELSAQMTACAVSENPAIILCEWYQHLLREECNLQDMKRMREIAGKHAQQADIKAALLTRQQEEEAIYAHKQAAKYGIALAAGEAGLIPQYRSKKAPGKNSCESLLHNPHSNVLQKLVLELIDMDPEKIRLIFKNIYQREFKLGTFDERPFKKIDEQGNLQGEPLIKLIFPKNA